MANLKHLPLLCFILVLATISIPIGHCSVLQPQGYKLIEKTCMQTPHPSVCIKILEAEKSSYDSGVRGLALIMFYKIKSNADRALIKITSHLRSGGDKKALTSCSYMYDEVVEIGIPRAIKALIFRNTMVAEDVAVDASNEAFSCEASFVGKSPLTKENDDMRIMAEVTRAIVKLLD